MPCNEITRTFDPLTGQEIIVTYSDILSNMSDSFMNLMLLTGVCFIMYFMINDDSQLNVKKHIKIGSYQEDISFKGLLETFLLLQAIYMILMVFIYKTGVNL